MTPKEYRAKKKALIAEIEHAFAGVERDADVVEWLDQIPDYIIWDEEKASLLSANPHWSNISDDWITNDSLSILTHTNASSFRYLLPAYLTWFLRSMDSAKHFRSSIFHSIGFNLTVRDHQSEFQLTKFVLLSAEQSQAVAHFLVFQCERFIYLYEQEEEDLQSSRRKMYRGQRGYRNAYSAPQYALQQYWGQFLGPDFNQPDFPYSAPRKRWRALWKEPDPQKRELYEAKKATIIAEIEQAFDGVQRGDGVTIYETGVLDNYGSPDELAEARALATETRWQDISQEDIRCCNALFLDEQGLHYYCPALLIASLHDFDSEDEEGHPDSFSKLEFKLSFSSGDESPSFDEKFAFFSTPQKRAIGRYFQFKYDQWDFYLERSAYPHDADWLKGVYEGIQKSLDAYWGQFL